MPRAGYEEASPTFLPKAQVYKLAESIAEQLGFKPGDDIHQFIEKVGGTVKVEDTLTEDPEKSGSLFVDGPSNFTIIVPAHTSQARDRFTIAHEFGHFILHYVWARKYRGATFDRMMALRKGSDRVEWEANWFASGFLMPEAAFRETLRRLGTISAVASDFEVSSAAAEIRAKQLGLM